MKLVLFLLFLFWLYNYWRFSGKRKYYKAMVSVMEHQFSIHQDEQTCIGLASAYMQAQRYSDAYILFNDVLTKNPYSLNADVIKTNMDFCMKPLPWSKKLRNHSMGYWHNFMLVRFGRRRKIMIPPNAYIETDNFIKYGTVLNYDVSYVKEPLDVHNYSDSEIIIPSPKNLTPDELSNGKVHLALGKIQDYKGQDKIEDNLLQQIATYNSAILLGDKQVFLKYLYKDAIVYYRSYYNTLSDGAITERMFKSLSQSYNEQLNRFHRHGIEFSMAIPSLIRKVKQGNNIFIVFNITSNLCSESLYTHFADYEQTLGISHNNGQNWSFIEMNNDAINILRISNDEEVINAVLRR